jgi:ankyrin repeat protein
MGSSQSTVEETDRPSLSALVSAEPVDWDLVRQSLHEEPEQACLYAHGVEPSQLLVALNRSAPVDVVELLINSYEDALDHPSPNGDTVLHVACDDEGIVDLVLKKRTQMVQAKDFKGRLPLHLCSNYKAAKQLLKAFPQALSQRSHESGSLPLHHALSRESIDGQLLNVLVERTLRLPEGGVLTRNKKGQTPLFLLVKRLEVEIVKDLWKVLLTWIRRLQPNSLEMHTLIEYGCCNSEHLMNHALKYFSKQACERDHLGRTPLHVAASIGYCSTEALDTLIRANPNAPRMTDNQGRLPIDWAAESPHTQLHCLALLMKGEPRAIDTRDLRDGHYPFLSAALGEQQSINNTYYLLRAKPHVLSYLHTPYEQ